MGILKHLEERTPAVHNDGNFLEEKDYKNTGPAESHELFKHIQGREFS